jgi:hypothetical protein
VAEEAAALVDTMAAVLIATGADQMVAVHAVQLASTEEAEEAAVLSTLMLLAEVAEALDCLVQGPLAPEVRQAPRVAGVALVGLMPL